MANLLEFTATARINSLYWITSLRDNEQGVARRVLEDLQPLCVSRQLPFACYSPTNGTDFLKSLDDIASHAQTGLLPLIHLDTHASAEDGIKISRSGEHVGWPEIAAKLRVINRITGNNLCVVSGACNSFSLVGQVDINQTTPAFILLAPEKEIAAGEIEDSTVGFYRDMLDNEDILTSRDKWFGRRLRTYHCEKFLAIILAKYLNNAAVGRQLERRKEHLVTLALEGREDHATPEVLRALRAAAKAQLKPSEDLIERFRATFLVGKQPGFTIAELKAGILQARADGVTPDGIYA